MNVLGTFIYNLFFCSYFSFAYLLSPSLLSLYLYFYTYAFYFLALIVAWAAASLAIGTLYGEHDT